MILFTAIGTTSASFAAEAAAPAEAAKPAKPVEKTATAGNGQKQKELLIINSYNEGSPWSNSIIEPVIQHSAMHPEYVVRVVNFNACFVTDKESYERAVNGVLTLYESDRPDGVIMLGDIVFTMLDTIKRAWGDLPTILVGQGNSMRPTEFYYTGKTGETNNDPYGLLEEIRNQYDFTFMESSFQYKETIGLMLDMNPDLEKVVFASDELAVNRHLNTKIRKYIETNHPELEYEWVVADKENAGQLLDLLTKKSKKKIGVLFSSWFYVSETVNGYPTIISHDYMVLPQSKYPVYSMQQSYLKYGTLGGYFQDQDSFNEHLVENIDKMIKGKKMNEIPFYYPSEFNTIINYPLLIQEGYSVDDCPSGTVFIDRPKRVWDQYFWFFIGVIVAVGIIVAVLIQRYHVTMKLMKSQQAYGALVGNMPIGFVQIRAQYNAERHIDNLVYIHGNQMFTNIYNKTGGDSPTSLFNDSGVHHMVECAINDRKSISFTHYFKEMDRYYEFIITPGHDEEFVHMFAVDTTKRCKAEQTLHNSRKQLEMTINVARIIPWQWDLFTDLIKCDSKNVIDYLDFQLVAGSQDDMMIFSGDEFIRHVHPEDLEKVREMVDGLKETGNSFAKQTEFRIIPDLGNPENVEWLEINAAIDKTGETGQPVSLMGSVLVITERKRQEAALIEAREQAQESDRLKSAFLANMSHEIRTPLNAIVGFSNLLVTTQDEKKKEKFIGIIENNNDLLLQLISDILDLAKVEANTLEFTFHPVDINAMMQTLESTIRMRVKPNVRLNLILGSAQCMAETEYNRVSQVIINLLTNACKFTDRGNITFGYEIQGDQLYFYVRDTGIGIDPAKCSMIFERFTKLNTFAQGTGLGLSICQSIVHKLGGEIGAESRGPNTGSTFWFTIPFNEVTEAEYEDLPTEKEPEKETIDKSQRLTILIAEDNESNYLLFEQILSKNYNLIHAWDGVEAVEDYKKYHPNMILMDINMPNMDGYQATREIRKENTKVPILAVTAYAFASDKERILENGFNGYVSKPVNPNNLMDEVKSTIQSTFVFL